jgi:type I restriction enzyme M protein
MRKTRTRNGEVLFIDARKMGTMTSRVHRELTGDDIARIVGTYRAWNDRDDSYQDILGFCASATIADIAKHGYVLTPGRYVGAEEVEDDGEPFDEKMKRLTEQLASQFAESSKLERAIKERLESLGYEF